MIVVYTRKEAAEILRISVETLDRYRKRGKLTSRKIGRCVLFKESDLIDFLDACAVPATAVPTDREKRGIAKRQGVQNENAS